MYALHALLSVADGQQREASVECADFDEVVSRLRELVDGDSPWRAVTLLHIEDSPLTLRGTTRWTGS